MFSNYALKEGEQMDVVTNVNMVGKLALRVLENRTVAGQAEAKLKIDGIDALNLLCVYNR